MTAKKISDRFPQQLEKILSLKRAILLVWQSSPTWTVAHGILLTIQGLLPLLSLYLTKLIIDAVTLAVENPQTTEGYDKIIWLVVAAAGVTLAGDMGASASNFVQEAQSEIVTDYVQTILHGKSIKVDLEYYENSQYYDALHRAQQEAPYRPTFIIRELIIACQSAISLGAIALLLFSLHWSITALLFLAVLPVFFVRLKYARKFYRRWTQWTPQEREAEYLNGLMTSYDYAKEIRLFNLGSYLQKRFRNLRTAIRNDKLTLSRQRSTAEVFTQGSATLGVFAAFGFIVYQTLTGTITIGSLVMYYQAFQKGQRLLRATLSSLASLYENSLFIANLSEFLDLKPQVIEPVTLRKVPQPLQWGIKFDHVKFSYPHSDRSVLTDINFTIKAGETIALVGQNGAGKTSLVKLLCRLYDPTQGKITLDGIDLREFATRDLRKHISVVFQDYARYNLTVRENIGFSNLDLLPQEDMIKSAAKAAGADSAINRLPHGYETILGHEFAEGEELSIGEWQKIAIARAFLHQAQIIILDEPTSALDPAAESEVLEQFRQLTTNRTAILISHRLSTVKLADRIFVLEGGRITEYGSHEELIQLQGTYARLFETQAQYYR